MQVVLLIAFFLVLCTTSITSKDDFGAIETNEECKKMPTEFWKYVSGLCENLLPGKIVINSEIQIMTADC